MSYSTTDIAFASYLVQIGNEIEAVERRGRKVIWTFSLLESDLNSAEAKWPSSHAAKFYSIYQTLKTHIKTPKK